jgi:hypothetical protein
MPIFYSTAVLIEGDLSAFAFESLILVAMGILAIVR